MLRLFAVNIARACEVVDVKKLFFICAATPLKSLYYMLNSGIVYALVARNRHLVFFMHFVHVYVVYSVTVAYLFVWAFLLLRILGRFSFMDLLMIDIFEK